MARRRRYKGSNRREIVCISAVVVILLGVMLMQSDQLKKKNVMYVQEIACLDAQIEEESERAEKIEQLKLDVRTPEYAGEIARERLGMVGEDEILFRAAD